MSLRPEIAVDIVDDKQKYMQSLLSMNYVSNVFHVLNCKLPLPLWSVLFFGSCVAGADSRKRGQSKETDRIVLMSALIV